MHFTQWYFCRGFKGNVCHTCVFPFKWNLYQNENVHGSVFQLLVQSNQGILQWGCQHPEHWFLQWRTRHSKHEAKHAQGLNRATADLVPGEVRQGEFIFMNYSSAHVALVESHASVHVCASACQWMWVCSPWIWPECSASWGSCWHPGAGSAEGRPEPSEPEPLPDGQSAAQSHL